MAQWDERNTPGSGTYGSSLNGNVNGGVAPGTAGGAVSEADAQAQMQQMMENARVELDRYVSAAADFVRERPVACIAGAVAVGFLVGKLASRK